MLRAQRIVLLLALLALSSAASAAQKKVGVVDVRRAMTTTSDWKKAVASLEKDRAAKQAVLEAGQAELRARKEKLEAQKAVSDPKATVAEEEKLFRAAQALTQEYFQTQQQLTYREKALTDRMLKRIDRIVQEIFVKGEYTIIFDTGTEGTPNVLYSKKSIDMTDKVIAAYKKKYKGKPLKLK